MDDFEATLRKLTVRDERLYDAVLRNDVDGLAASGLDRRTRALVRIGALAAVDAAAQSYAPCIEAARAEGVTSEEITGVLVALLPILGSPRIESAAPRLGLALGYDLDAALEEAGTGV